MSNLPLFRPAHVYHIGEMDSQLKRQDSYEGAGLSISLHPSAWRRIARGFVSGPCWSLSRYGATLLDAHALKRTLRREIIAWAIAQGYAEEAPLWRWRYWDDDFDDFVIQHFATGPDAAAERYNAEVGTVRKIASHRSTPALNSAAMQTKTELSTNSVIDLVLPIWAYEVHGIDGVWWNDRLDPLSLSAPRGVLHPDVVPFWTAERLAFDPDDGDEA